MKRITGTDMEPADPIVLAPASSAPLSLPAAIGPETGRLLQRMFRDPRVLKSDERVSLVSQLRDAVELEPHVPEIRVLFGMALSVDLQAQEAMEQLREATRQAPDCYIARLKFGELLMRLRVCDQAAEHTQKAAELAANDVQADLARRQASAIRTMRREGIERGGLGKVLPWWVPSGRKPRKQETPPALAGSE
jgi:tetratricopeptide (TPR) repeat protein